MNDEQAHAIASMGRKNKYGAKATVVDGIRFDSMREANRYQELKLLERAGEIIHLRIQPEFELNAWSNGDRPIVGTYRGDFSYFDMRAKDRVVEDVKSPATKTALYRWKKRHMRAQYGIEIREV